VQIEHQFTNLSRRIKTEVIENSYVLLVRSLVLAQVKNINTVYLKCIIFLCLFMQYLFWKIGALQLVIGLSVGYDCL
jgi:hypothetical protein